MILETAVDHLYVAAVMAPNERSRELQNHQAAAPCGFPGQLRQWRNVRQQGDHSRTCRGRRKPGPDRQYPPIPIPGRDGT